MERRQDVRAAERESLGASRRGRRPRNRGLDEVLLAAFPRGSFRDARPRQEVPLSRVREVSRDLVRSLRPVDEAGERAGGGIERDEEAVARALQIRSPEEDELRARDLGPELPLDAIDAGAFGVDLVADEMDPPAHARRGRKVCDLAALFGRQREERGRDFRRR